MDPLDPLGIMGAIERDMDRLSKIVALPKWTETREWPWHIAAYGPNMEFLEDDNSQKDPAAAIMHMADGAYRRTGKRVERFVVTGPEGIRRTYDRTGAGFFGVS